MSVLRKTINLTEAVKIEAEKRKVRDHYESLLDEIEAAVNTMPMPDDIRETGPWSAEFDAWLAAKLEAVKRVREAREK